MGTGSLATVIADVSAHEPRGVRTCSLSLPACARSLARPPARPPARPGKLVLGVPAPARCRPPHSQLSAAQTSPKLKCRTTAAARARLSRELPGPPSHLPGLHRGIGRKFRRAAARKRDTPTLRQRAASAQAPPLCCSSSSLCLHQAVGSYVAPGPPEAEGGTARPGTPRARRLAVCPP